MRFLARFAMRGPYHAAALAAAAQVGSLLAGLLILTSVVAETLASAGQWPRETSRSLIVVIMTGLVLSFVLPGQFAQVIGLSVLALVVMLIALLPVVTAGAVVALSTLRHGSSEGLRVMLTATAAAMALRLLLPGGVLPTLVFCLALWLPAWVIALNLRRTRRQALPLVMVAVLVATYAVAVRIAVGDVTAFWGEQVGEWVAPFAAQADVEFTPEQLQLVAAAVHPTLLVGLFGVLAGIVLLARWWQAALYNPGGFGSEFREIRMPRGTLALTALAGLLLVIDAVSGLDLSFAADAFVIVVLLFAFQGLAVVHARVRSVGASSGWLVWLYTLLLFTPQVVGPVLATTGVADELADFRRLASRNNDTD